MPAGNEGPIRPEAKPVSLQRGATAVAVLDLSMRCHNPDMSCSRLLPVLAPFLEKARTFGIPIIYTISFIDKGTPLGEVAHTLGRRETESVINPDGFDKFTGGDLQNLLQQRKTRNLIIVGASTNIAVLYTATAAARVYHYNVILPIDVVNARTEYEHEYALHQLSVLPRAVITPIQFTTLSMITFL